MPSSGPTPLDPGSDATLSRAIAANLPNGSAFVIGPDLRYRLADGEALREAGFSPADFEGKTVAEAVGPELAGQYETNIRLALGGQSFRLEHASHERHYVTHGAALRDAAGEVFAALAVSYDITVRVTAEADLRAARDHLEERVRERTAQLAEANARLATEAREREAADAARAELLRKLISAQEDVRRRIARELHDQMGQLLAGLTLELRAVEKLDPADPDVRVRLRRLQELGDQLGREAHNLAIELRPTALDDLGLQAALAVQVEGWSRRSGVVADLHCTGLSVRLPSAVETAVYRIVQESLTNVLRHAGAGRVSVVVESPDGQLLVAVEDDGRGFDPAAVKPGPAAGLGLAGMRERAAEFGGTLQIESTPGGGTTVFARVPIPHPPEAAP